MKTLHYNLLYNASSLQQQFFFAHHHALNNKSARWLEQAGFDIARDASGKPTQNIEISPLFALNSEDVIQKKDRINFSSGDIYLE